VDASAGKLVDAVLPYLRGRGPHVVGIAGAVAVGKTTAAEQLALGLEQRGRRPHIVATDAFLHPNAVLTGRGIAYRKGFPESYDMQALAGFLTRVRSGAPRTELPVYSHTAYDIVAGRADVVERPDLVIVEGVVALQPPAADSLDVGIFVDAREEDVRGWFITRFLRLTDQARREPASFYARFAEMGADEVRELAAGTWDAINGPNLHDHILPTRARAHVVVEKGGDHTVVRVVVARPPEPDQAAESDC
jgi:type I pantothenate kinase